MDVLAGLFVVFMLLTAMAAIVALTWKWVRFLWRMIV